MTRTNPYNPGHPWYYVLGGQVLFPNDILISVRLSGYEGCSAHRIHELDKLAEPRRSQGLRSWRAKVQTELQADLRRYIMCSRELGRYRKANAQSGSEPSCEGVHVAISLKHNHLYNDLAHLELIEGLLAKQADLFDL